MRSPTITLLSVRRSLPLFLSVVVCLAIWQVIVTWRMLKQDSDLAAQRTREHLEQLADLAVSQVAGAVGEWEFTLRQIEALPPAANIRTKLTAGTYFILLQPQSVTTYPTRPILFVPAADPGCPLPPVFDVAEKLEFRDKDYQQAIVALKPLAEVPATRAEALLRLARLARKLNRLQSALENYDLLSREAAVSPDGVPYALLAAGARCELLPHSDAPAQLRASLLAGRWPLRRETFEFYWTELNRWQQTSDNPPAHSLDLSLFLLHLHDQWRRSARPEASYVSREITSKGSLLIWHATPLRLVVLSAPPGWLVSVIKLPASARNVRWQWAESGASPIDAAPHVLRSLAEAQLKGKLDFSDIAAGTGGRVRGSLWLTGVALMLLLLLAGAYAIYRGVSRELRVARLQSDFVAAVSHEFRSPLTSLRGITELLAEGRLVEPSRRRQSYAFLQRETGRLQHLVENLLDFGHMESGRKQYHAERHDAFGLVRSAVDDFKEEAHGSGFKIEVDLAASASTVHADEEALRRAIRNLLENAVKYSQDSRTVRVEGRVIHHRVIISVHDQGMGIPASEQREIFQKFVRGEAAKSAGIKGTGVGLSMVRQIVQASGGEIRLESAPGIGSTFTILLPLAHQSEKS